MRKNCSSDREKLLKFETEGREFAKILRSLDQIEIICPKNVSQWNSAQMNNRHHTVNYYGDCDLKIAWGHDHF